MVQYNSHWSKAALGRVRHFGHSISCDHFVGGAEVDGRHKVSTRTCFPIQLALPYSSASQIIVKLVFRFAKNIFYCRL
jgi:hypothetical protein